MRIENLKTFDNTFHLVFCQNADVEVFSISDSSEIYHQSLIFIKNKNFLKSLLEKTLEEKAEKRNVGIVFEAKFFEVCSREERAHEFFEELKSKFDFYATVLDINVAMSKMSHAFYQIKYPGPNDLVDGRIMGTASIHPSAYVAQGVFIGENVKIAMDVKIHPGCVLMSGVEIENGTEIFPNTTIYRNVKIGRNVRIHGGCTIGADGFGYNFFQGEHLKVWHMGSVVISDNVEIGANSCVDSGTFSPTLIGEGTKIDNLVQVGHNCKVGKKVILCGHVALAGSCVLQDYVVVGGKTAIGNGVEIGAGAQIAGFSGVTSDVMPKEVVGGFPARNIKEWMKGVATLRKLSLGGSNATQNKVNEKE